MSDLVTVECCMPRPVRCLWRCARRACDGLGPERFAAASLSAARRPLFPASRLRDLLARCVPLYPLPQPSRCPIRLFMFRRLLTRCAVRMCCRRPMHQVLGSSDSSAGVCQRSAVGIDRGQAAGFVASQWGACPPPPPPPPAHTNTLRHVWIGRMLRQTAHTPL